MNEALVSKCVTAHPRHLQLVEMSRILSREFL